MPEATPARRPGVRRAPRSSRPGASRWRRLRRAYSAGTGRRIARRDRRRARGLLATLGLTWLGAVIPGSGYLYAGRKALGGLVFLAWLGIVGVGIWYVAGRGLQSALDLVFDPARLRLVALALGIGLLVWALVVFTSYRLVRPRDRPRWHTAVGNVWVVVICLVMAVPVGMTARASLAQADLVNTLFQDKSATTPRNVSEEDPWGGQDRVNVLLLGGDGGEGRTGVRTDTVILVSLNTHSGRTVMFSLPRNMMNAQFPEGSPLAEVYPDGYASTDEASGMLNAIYKTVPEARPGVLGDSDNEGADAIKQAVEGSLGVPVHYYVLVNLSGFREIVDAMGGVTVNINEPVAIEGNTDLGIPPKDWLEPGPDQHLDGYHALWFARGRWGSDDYERMERQRCMIDAIVEAADPFNLLTKYQRLAAAGKEVVYTDIPLDLAPAFADLALDVKDANMKSVVFQRSENFTSADPDFEWMREVVQRNLQAKKTKKKGNGSTEGSREDPDAPVDEETEAPTVAEKPGDVCAYQPEDSDDVDDEELVASE